MNVEKQRAFVIRIAYIVLIMALAYISIKYVVPILMPFVIAVIVATILRPIIDGIEKKTRLKRSAISIVILIIFYGVLILIVNIFGISLFAFLKDVFYQLPNIYQEKVVPVLDKIVVEVMERFPEIELYFDNIFDSIKDSILSFLTKASSTVVGTITGFASQLPSVLIRFIFTIVASFFFTIDYHPIGNFLLRQFSESQRKMLIMVRENVIGSIWKFIKAYTTLILITFSELAIGFLILGVPNSFLWAAVISLVDLLPILGTGAVLIPWVVLAFLFKKTSFAIGMLILYIVITIVRQTLEPRVVGQQIGLHPLVTLICMFVGAQLLGVLGLLLLPIAATIIKKMNDEGTIRIFK